MTQFNPLVEKAERFIRSAELLADNSDFDSAASRLYYAMFYVAEALLDARGLSFSSHKAVISAYGQYFAKTNELDPRFHQVLITSFNQRQLGDYHVESGLRKDDIDSLMTDTVDFLQAGRKWLENLAQGNQPAR